MESYYAVERTLQIILRHIQLNDVTVRKLRFNYYLRNPYPPARCSSTTVLRVGLRTSTLTRVYALWRRVISSFHELIQSRAVRRLSVCKLFAQFANRFYYTTQMAPLRPKLHTVVSR